MTPLENIIAEASNLQDQQLCELLAMAKGMDAANRIAQEQGA